MPPHNSLVRYDNPLIIITNKDPRGRRKGDDKSNLSPTEDILNSILPPREWTEDGVLLVQYVSATPATRQDVITLQVIFINFIFFVFILIFRFKSKTYVPCLSK